MTRAPRRLDLPRVSPSLTCLTGRCVAPYGVFTRTHTHRRQGDWEREDEMERMREKVVETARKP